MPVTDVTTDQERHTLTMKASFTAPVERIWQVYADPRQLEQVFGPPTYPATFVVHEFSPGGRAHYFMTSPEGERFYGWWRITALDEPRSFAFDDGFAADDTFAPIDEMPVSQNLYAFEAMPEGTEATFTSVYASAEALQQVLDMGMIEGATSAINQIDALVAR